MKKLLPVLLLLVVATSASAAVWNVNVNGNFTFSPTPLTINKNDTVHWIWVAGSGMHSTTSDPGQIESWDSSLHGAGFTYDHSFANLGTFRYYCSLHGDINGQGMSGTVTVVPEPAGISALLSLTGAVSIGRMLRRRARARPAAC